MKVLRSLLLGIVTSITVLGIIAVCLPDTYQVEQKVFIQAPPKIVFEQINTLPHWQNWAFAGYGEDMPKLSFSGPMDGQGAIYSWSQGDYNNRTEIISSRPFDIVQLRMITNNGEFSSQANFTLEPMEGGTLLHWTECGEVGFKLQARLLIALGGLEKSLSSNYETALQALKAHCESITWE